MGMRRSHGPSHTFRTDTFLKPYFRLCSSMVGSVRAVQTSATMETRGRVWFSNRPVCDLISLSVSACIALRIDTCQGRARRAFCPEFDYRGSAVRGPYHLLLKLKLWATLLLSKVFAFLLTWCTAVKASARSIRLLQILVVNRQ